MTLGTQQQRVLCLMDSNGGRLPLTRHWKADAPVAESLITRGLAVRLYPDGDTPDVKLTDEGRIEAARIRAGRPEYCFTCDKGEAVYVGFSGAQTGQDMGYPSVHLYCEKCASGLQPGRLYRMTRVSAAVSGSKED